MKIKRLKSKGIRIFLFVLLPAGIAAAFFVQLALFAQKTASIYRELKKYTVKQLPASCTVTAFGTGSRTFSASISFFTPEGRRIGSYERSWNGSLLYMECVVFSFQNASIIFPYRLYSDASKSGTGTKLFAYYDIDGFPAIYSYPFLSKTEKKLIKSLFSMAVFSPKLMMFLGRAKIKTAVLNSFVQDTEYSLVLDDDNTLIFKRNF